MLSHAFKYHAPGPTGQPLVIGQQAMRCPSSFVQDSFYATLHCLPNDTTYTMSASLSGLISHPDKALKLSMADPEAVLQKASGAYHTAGSPIISKATACLSATWLRHSVHSGCTALQRHTQNPVCTVCPGNTITRLVSRRQHSCSTSMSQGGTAR